MANVKTITLGGVEQKVIISGQNCDIRNDGADTIYASAQPNITAGADGVLAIPVGQAAKLLDTKGTVYLKGTGIVQICGSDYSDLVFKCAATSSGEGGEVTKTYVDNGDKTSLQLAKQFAEENFSNPNLIDNPDFNINQRDQTEYINAGSLAVYGFDRWTIIGTIRKTEDNVIISPENSPYGYGRLLQHIPYDYTGATLTLSAKINGEIKSVTGICGSEIVTIGEDDSWYCAFQVSNSETLVEIIAFSDIALEWVKLELGSVATPFTPPDPATELAKCQRCYEVLMHANVDRGILGYYDKTTRKCHFDIPFKVTKRVSPSLVNSQFRIVIYNLLTNELCMARPMDMIIYDVDTEGMYISTATAVSDDITLPDECIVTLDTVDVGGALAVSCEL